MYQHQANKSDISLHRFTGLPRGVRPIHYQLLLKPDQQNGQLEGNVQVELDVERDTQEIVLNAKDLKVQDANLRTDSGKNIKCKIDHDEKEEIVRLNLNGQSLSRGKARLEMTFRGQIQEQMRGLYRKRCDDNDREKRCLVADCDPSATRMIFPCFDEPDFKATFELTLQTQSDQRAISNTQVVEEKASGSNKLIRFAKTPKMATHHFSFVIGKFEQIERQCEDILLRFHVTEGKKNNAKWTIDATNKLVEYFKKNLQEVKYPMSQIDFVVLPSYHRDGAGNFGLIYVHEDLFFVDENQSPLDKKINCTLNLAKQIARQWFGNVVSSRWWTQRWLTEGFATFMCYKAVDSVYSNYNVWKHFLHREVECAMRHDTVDSTHPLEDNLYWMYAGEHFNKHWMHQSHESILCSKGAAIHRMVCHMVGKENFQRAMQRFLNDNKYDCVTSDDWWNALERECRKPVRSIMQSWTQKKGFPVVHVEGKADQSGNYRLNIRQENVIRDQDKVESFGKYQHENQNQQQQQQESIFNRWVIPMTISVGPNRRTDDKDWVDEQDRQEHMMEVLLNQDQMDIVIPNHIYRNSGGCININALHMGYFVVKYHDEMMRGIMEHMEKQTMHTKDRMGIVLDTFQLVKKGDCRTTDYLELLQKCAKREDNDAMWQLISQTLCELRHLATCYDHANQRDELETKLGKFVQNIADDVYRKIGNDWQTFHKQNKDKSFLQQTITELMVIFKQQQVQQKANEMFDQRNRNVTILRCMLITTAQNNQDRALKELCKIYKENDFCEAREYCKTAFGFFNDRNTIKQAIDFTLSDQVGKEDSLEFLVSMAQWNPNGRDTVCQCLKDNANSFTKHFGDHHLAFNFLEGIIEQLFEEDRAKDIATTFLDDDKKTQMRHALDYIRLKNNWLKRDLDSMKRFLANY